MEKAKERVVVKMNYPKDTLETHPLQRHPDTGRYDAGNSRDQTLDRNLLSLQNRGLRKANYLKGLMEFYKNDQSPKSLIDALSAPHQSNGESTGLVPGVRMEAIDPWHRPVEVKFQNGKLEGGAGLEDPYSSSSAFIEWYNQLQTNTPTPPYFLWLENHAICTRNNKDEIAGTSSVEYLDPSTYSKNDLGNVRPRFKLAVVYRYVDHLAMWKPGEEKSDWASTLGYNCNSKKGVNGEVVPKLNSQAKPVVINGKRESDNFVIPNEWAAYIWNKNDHMIVIAQHQETSFHHSSFTGGSQVNCAGMIQIKNGKVVYVSNNSGHYKPSKELLAIFVEYLDKNRLFDHKAIVDCFGLKQPFKNSPKLFLKNYRSLV